MRSLVAGRRLLAVRHVRGDRLHPRGRQPSGPISALAPWLTDVEIVLADNRTDSARPQCAGSSAAVIAWVMQLMMEPHAAASPVRR